MEQVALLETRFWLIAFVLIYFNFHWTVSLNAKSWRMYVAKRMIQINLDFWRKLFVHLELSKEILWKQNLTFV